MSRRTTGAGASAGACAKAQGARRRAAAARWLGFIGCRCSLEVWMLAFVDGCDGDLDHIDNEALNICERYQASTES